MPYHNKWFICVLSWVGVFEQVLHQRPRHILKGSDKVWKLGQWYWGSGSLQPIVACNANLARNLVHVFRRSVRGKAKQLEKGVKEVSDYRTVIFKKRFSAGDLGCFSDQLLPEKWADGDRMVRGSMCSWIFEADIPCSFSSIAHIGLRPPWT